MYFFCCYDIIINMDNTDLIKITALEGLPRAVAVFDSSFSVLYTNAKWKSSFASCKTICGALGCRRFLLGNEIPSVCSGCDIFSLCNKNPRVLGRLSSNSNCSIPLVRGKMAFAVSQLNDGVFALVMREMSHYESGISGDLERARHIQESFIPEQNTEIGGCRFLYSYRQQFGVGGDLFGGYCIDDHTTGVYIADVSGAGISGSLLTGFIRLGLDRSLRSPAKAISRLRELIQSVDLPEETYITLLLITLDFEKHTLTFCNAAHNQPVFLRRKEGLCCIEKAGPPISCWGIANEEYVDSVLTFQEGDVLALYTDGVIDNRNAKGERFPEDSVQKLLESGKSIDDMLVDFEDKVKRFKNGKENDDDLTMVLVEITK